jgi:hypothetical protein
MASGSTKWVCSGVSSLALAAGLGVVGPAVAGEAAFTVMIEQLTTDGTLELPDGSATKSPLSPGTAVVFRGANPLPTVGEPASPGLQRQAEAGQPEDLLAAMKAAEGVSSAVMFDRTDTSRSQLSPARC